MDDGQASCVCVTLVKRNKTSCIGTRQRSTFGGRHFRNPARSFSSIYGREMIIIAVVSTLLGLCSMRCDKPSAACNSLGASPRGARARSNGSLMTANFIHSSLSYMGYLLLSKIYTNLKFSQVTINTKK